MSFFFRYKACTLDDGTTVHRPLIAFRLAWRDKTLDTFGMLDSGSDTAIIPLGMAEALGLEFGMDNTVFGLDKKFMKVREARVNLTIGSDRESYTLPTVVHVPMVDIPINVVMGRQGIFDNFEITFNQAQKKIRFKKLRT